MAMVDVSELFCMDPEGFMRENIVMQRIGLSDPGLIAVVVYQDTRKKVGNKIGARVCVMAKAKPDQKPALPSYWCPYKDNDIKSAMLGDEALFAFTPTMDGCSVGLGSETDTGAQMLCHVNAKKVGAEWSQKGADIVTGRARQSASQRAQLVAALGHDATFINPGDYRQDGHGEHTMSSTTYGIHALGKPWTIYTQTYRQLSELTFIHGGVTSF